MAFRTLWRAALPAAALALTLAACDTEPTVYGEEVGGVNVTQLFAAPTDAEKLLITTSWQARVPGLALRDTATYRTFGYTAAGSAQGPFINYRVYIVSHSVPSGDGSTFIKHYGAIMVPSELLVPGNTTKAAVMVYNHGGDKGVSVAEAGLFASLLTPGTTAKKPIIWVAPSFRSEALSWAPNGVPGTTVTASETVTSGGLPSPWDYDVDDALSLLNVTLAKFPTHVDASKIGVMGVSRGGNVALQMGIRDDRVTRVLDIFGPTDFLSEWVQGITRRALGGETVALPGFDALNAGLIQPLKNGARTIPEVRNQIIRRSPVYFTDKLTEPVQIQHGTADQTVLVSESDVLARALGATPQTTFTGTLAAKSYFRWEGGVHNPSSFPTPAWIGAAQTFIAPL